MKLYLSSYRIPTPDDLFALIGKEPSAVTVALIPNAKDYYAERAWNVKVNEVKGYIEQLGPEVDVIDLRKYRGSELAEKLKSYDLIWAAGGNTFNLRYEMKQSGFDTIIREVLESGAVYGGDSAGAIVAGPTLQGTEIADDPAFAEATITEGLHLTDLIVIPHADNPSLKGGVEPMIEMYQNNPDAIVLNDSQAVIVDGSEHRVVASLN